MHRTQQPYTYVSSKFHDMQFWQYSVNETCFSYPEICWTPINFLGNCGGVPFSTQEDHCRLHVDQLRLALPIFPHRSVGCCYFRFLFGDRKCITAQVPFFSKHFVWRTRCDVYSPISASEQSLVRRFICAINSADIRLSKSEWIAI